MVSGEYEQQPVSGPEIEGEQLKAQIGEVAGAMALSSQVEEATAAQLLERARAHPAELDMSFADTEGAAQVAQLDEGIYKCSTVADALLPSDSPGGNRRLFYNVIFASERIVPLKNGEFYVKPAHERPGMATHERAEAIVDRIAELSKITPGAYVDDLIEQVRKEGRLLNSSDAALAEKLCRGNLRLLTRHETIAPNTEGPARVDKVLDALPALPATVGEAVDRMVDEVNPGSERTGTKWVRRMRGRFFYTTSTVRAFHRAIEHDPRFTLTRQTDRSETSAYSLGLAEGQLPPLPTKGDIYRTPIQELVERAVALCGPYNLLMKSDLPELIARGKDLSERTRRLILQGVMEDPRVSVTESPHYLKIVQTPEDAQKYDELAGVVHTAIETLLDEGPRLLSLPQLTEYMRAAAMREGIELTKHARYMLHSLVRIDPRVEWSREDQKMKVSTPPPAPVTVEQTPEPEAPPEISPEEAAAQAAARTVELMRLLGRERIAALHAVAQIVITRRIDEATTTVLVDRLMNLAEGVLAQQSDDSPTAEEREYLEGVFVHHEKFEPVEDRPGVLRVRTSEGSTGVIRGVGVENLSHFSTTYGRKR